MKDYVNFLAKASAQGNLNKEYYEWKVFVLCKILLL